MVRRSRALINPDKESRQYRQDLEYLKTTPESKSWYYEEDLASIPDNQSKTENIYSGQSPQK